MNIRKICAFLALTIVLSLLPGVPLQVNAVQGQTDLGETLLQGSDPGIMPAANDPTAAPTAKPTAAPTTQPTAVPTTQPTAAPTTKPTAAPTVEPTKPATTAPTEPEGPMTVSDAFIEVLKTMEGFHPVAYWDYSQWTIGYGTKCPDGKEKYYTKENPMTEKEAVALLHGELAYFEKVVNNYAEKYKLKLKQHQFDALVSFSYNCGAAWTKDVNGYLNVAIREGNMGNGFIYGMVLWSKANTDYLLVNRRKCEANMYINGVYKAYNTPNSIPQNFKHVFLDGNGGTVKYVPHGYDAKDPTEVITEFTAMPTGVDKDGKTFTYTFAGWFTEPTGGEQVTILDGSLANGAVLFAQWKNPEGEIVPLPKGDVVDNVEVTVTGRVNVRSGPGTYYPIKQELQKGTALVITETFKVNNTLWGKCEFGWLSLHYTDYADVVSGNTAIPTDGLWGTVSTETGGTVNVRTGPSTSYGIAYTAKTGDRVQIFALKTDGTLQWGQLKDGNWICMDYVVKDPVEKADLESISIEATPEKLEYVQMQDKLDLTGSILRLTFSDGSVEMADITQSMVTGFSNEKLGEITLTVAYENMAVSFAVTIVKATVTFKNYDGKVLSTAQYAYGETVKVPETPQKPSDKTNSYKFAGWDKEVTTCKGDAVYTAVYKAAPLKIEGVVATDSGGTVNVRTGPGTNYDVAYEVKYKTKVQILETKSDGKLLWGKISDGNWICMDYVLTEAAKGDMDGNYVLDEDDAIYLLRHVIFPEKYPLKVKADVNADKKTNEDDAIYLLRYVVFPDKYPLKL